MENILLDVMIGMTMNMMNKEGMTKHMPKEGEKIIMVTTEEEEVIEKDRVMETMKELEEGGEEEEGDKGKVLGLGEEVVEEVVEEEVVEEEGKVGEESKEMGEEEEGVEEEAEKEEEKVREEREEMGEEEEKV